jgi:hypothetical protein
MKAAEELALKSFRAFPTSPLCESPVAFPGSFDTALEPSRPSSGMN